MLDSLTIKTLNYIKHLNNNKRTLILLKMYGLYYNNHICYSVDISEFKWMPHVVQQKHQVSKYPERAYKNNMNIRKKGHLKQPGGSSCNQRR